MPTFSNIPQPSGYGLCAFAACLALAAQPAAAELASFSLPIPAVTVLGGATAGPFISLPDSGNPNFIINFVLPRDYQDNGAVRIVMYLSHATGECNVRFVASSLSRKRPGAAIVNSLAGLSGGSSLVGLPAGFNVIVAKSFTLSPGGPMPGQRRSDAFGIQFTRAVNASDTCSGPLSVQAIDIRYPLIP